MKYKIVQTSYKDELEKEVRKYISKGWEPLGGIQVIAKGECYSPEDGILTPVHIYFQAMIKREPITLEMDFNAMDKNIKRSIQKLREREKKDD